MSCTIKYANPYKKIPIAIGNPNQKLYSPQRTVKNILNLHFINRLKVHKIKVFQAQWIEHPPPKGRVARSIRAEGATISKSQILFNKF